MSRKFDENETLGMVADGFKQGFETAVLMLDSFREAYADRYDGKHNQVLKTLTRELGNYIINISVDDLKAIFKERFEEIRLQRLIMNQPLNQEDKPMIYMPTEGGIIGGNNGGIIS